MCFNINVPGRCNSRRHSWSAYTRWDIYNGVFANGISMHRPIRMLVRELWDIMAANLTHFRSIFLPVRWPLCRGQTRRGQLPLHKRDCPHRGRCRVQGNHDHAIHYDPLSGFPNTVENLDCVPIRTARSGCSRDRFTFGGVTALQTMGVAKGWDFFQLRMMLKSWNRKM